MSISAAIRRMLEAGLTIEQALVAAEAFEAEIEPVPAVDRAAEKRREWDRERKRKQRNSALSGGIPVETSGNQADAVSLSSPEVSPPHPPFLTPPILYPLRPPKGGSSPHGGRPGRHGVFGNGAPVRHFRAEGRHGIPPSLVAAADRGTRPSGGPRCHRADRPQPVLPRRKRPRLARRPRFPLPAEELRVDPRRQIRRPAAAAIASTAP